MPLKNVCDIRKIEVSENVETNLISFFDYGFLDKGAYFNVDIDQSGDYVNNLSSLTKVIDNRGFTYWAGPKNWVYESGADSSGVNAPPQIYVNGSLYALGSVNYRDGYVYNIPSTGTSVKAEFSYKWITMASASKIGGFGRKITNGQNRTDLDPLARSGAPEISIPLPFVSFDVPSISESQPWGMGGELTPMIYRYKAKATVVGESSADVKRIADIIVKQQGSAINTYDSQEVRDSGDYPLNANGTINSGKTHDELSDLYPGGSRIYLKSISSEKGPDLGNGLHQSIVNMTLEIVGCGCP